MAGIIDADTHIAELREMWNFLEPEWYPRMPVVVLAYRVPRSLSAPSQTRLCVQQRRHRARQRS